MRTAQPVPWFIALVLLAGTVLFGCPGKDDGMPRNTLATPEETVKAYCDLDAKGARLTSTTWAQVLPYISWTEEAGFDRAVVISGFTVQKARKNGEKAATVAVDYQVLGTLAGEYVASRRTETVRFTVGMTDRGWKISSPDFMPPHVSDAAMVKHLEGTKRLEQAGKIRSEAK